MSERTLSVLAAIVAVGAIDAKIGGKIENMELLASSLCNTARVVLTIDDVRYTVIITETLDQADPASVPVGGS
jgi:hypothetical protein